MTTKILSTPSRLSRKAAGLSERVPHLDVRRPPVAVAPADLALRAAVGAALVAEARPPGRAAADADRMRQRRRSSVGGRLGAIKIAGGLTITGS
eukprot:COSAG04_NODE_18117_length_450_cov_1.609687_2_plen_93_part_01